MRSPARIDDNNDEETSLLRVQSDDVSHKPTPLPTAQVLALFLPYISESVVSNSISPYINQLVRELPIVGGDGRKVGYYTGIIVSLHYVAEAVTALYWSRLSDHIGRKPVLLCCLTGTAASMVLFGFSRSFWTLVFSRCLHGALRGTLGVTKCAMAELTDETNMARGFSSLQFAWIVGYVIGPLIGGTLSRPQDRWPHLFSHPFWAEYPYMLPCLVVAAYCCMSWVLTAAFLKETMFRTPRYARMNSDSTLQGESIDALDASHKDTQKPPPLRSLLTRPVLVSIANYAMISILQMSSLALVPLIWSTPIEFGGLNLSPVSIGLWMSVYGCVDGACQFAIFPRLVARFGLRRVFFTCISSCAALIVMFPLENFVLRHGLGGKTMAIWPLIVLQLSSFSFLRMGYSAMSIYVSTATPNRRSLGAVNGLARTVASVQCAIGPLAADSLFAFSVTKSILGGNFVYIVLLSLVCVGLRLAALLPRHMWTHSGG